MSTEIKNGGPAFAKGDYVSRPCDSNQRIIKGADGMTLRDYFIAHAPAEPQPWFRPVMPAARPKAPATPPAMTDEEKFALYEWDEGYVLAKDVKCPRIRDYALAHERDRSEGAVWDKEHEKQRYLQWPAVWADAMLREREQQPC